MERPSISSSSTKRELSALSALDHSQSIPRAVPTSSKIGQGKALSKRPATTKEKWISAAKALVFFAALVPLGKLVWLGLHDSLGANPIEKITHITGWWALTFLMITLTATPLRTLSGWGWPLRFRRMLGLYAFFYASLHFLTYLVLDQFFDWTAIVKDIAKRPYITVGFPAFVLLIPLAVTSTTKMVQRLGAKRWKLLHRLVYVIAAAGVVHFWWLVKKDITEPSRFAMILAVLLGFRMVWAWRGRRRSAVKNHLERKSRHA